LSIRFEDDSALLVTMLIVVGLAFTITIVTSLLYILGYSSPQKVVPQSTQVVACGEREVELEFNYSRWLICNFDGSNCKPLAATPVRGGFYRICVPWEMSIKPQDYPWCCKVMRQAGWSPSESDEGRYYLVVKNGCAGLVKP